MSLDIAPRPIFHKDPKVASGHVREDAVIKLAEQAGFKLVERSEISANPKDTKDYPEGVWTLPPALRLRGSIKRNMSPSARVIA